MHPGDVIERGLGARRIGGDQEVVVGDDLRASAQASAVGFDEAQREEGLERVRPERTLRRCLLDVEAEEEEADEGRERAVIRQTASVSGPLADGGESVT